MRKKETTGVLSNTPRMGRSRKTSAVDDRNIVTARAVLTIGLGGAEAPGPEQGGGPWLAVG